MFYQKIASAARLLTLGMCLALSVPAAVTAQETGGIVYLPGKTLGLTPPPGFKLSNAFSGFIDAASGNSILLVELPPGVYSEVKAGMTAEGLAKQNITISSNEPIKIDGFEGILIKGKQSAGGKQVSKWILLLGATEATILLTVQDLTGDTLDDAVVMTALNSIKLREPPPLEAQVESLPFAMGDLAGFRIVRTILGSGVLLTKGPKDVVRDGSQPVLIIQRPIDRPFPTSVFPADLSDRLLRSVQSLNIVQIGDTVERTVAGAGGYETIATATDKVLESNVVVGQWLRLSSGEQMHVLAILPEDGHETLLPDLRKVVAELRLKAL